MPDLLLKSTKPLIRILGTLMIGNALFMVLLSRRWYETVPGVQAAGPFNAHFVIDIGLVYLSCGAFLLVGAARKVPLLVVAGSIWPFLHGVFHGLEWLVHGIPAASALLAEGLGVVLPALAGMACAVIALRHPETLA